MLRGKSVFLFTAIIGAVAWFIHKEALLLAVAFDLTSLLPHLLAKGYPINDSNFVSVLWIIATVVF
jgi:hypothetical protein